MKNNLSHEPPKPHNYPSIIRYGILIICAVFILLFSFTYFFKNDILPAESERVLAVSRLYKAAADYYCYFEEDNCDWDAAYEKALCDVLQVKNYRDYLNVLETFRSNLKDHHADGAIFLSGIPNIRDISVFPFFCTWCSGEYVVIKSADPQIHVGDVLQKVNYVDTGTWLEENLGMLVATGTPDTRERELIKKLFLYYPKGTSFSCSFKQPTGEKYTRRIKTGVYKEMNTIPVKPELSFGTDEQEIYTSDTFKVSLLPGNIWSVLCTSFQGKEVWDEFADQIYPLIQSAKGIIVDFRYNNGGNSTIGYAMLRTLSGVSVQKDSLETRYSLRIGQETTYAALLNGPNGALFREAFQGIFTDDEISAIEETGRRMNEGAFLVDEDTYTALWNLLKEAPITITDDTPSYNTLPLLSLPTVVLIDASSGSAVDTVAQMAADMGLTTVGTHTAGATGELYTVDLGGGLSTGFSSFYIYNNAAGVPIHNNGVTAEVQVDNDAASIYEGIDRQLIAAWKLFK